jgi:hypothetical protein
MAFHSKGGNISRSSRTNRRDKESILGLSGWLFADLLLAIAVIFLVVQDKAQPVDAGSETTTTTTTTTTTPPSEKTGLIADPSQQLKINIPGGASPGISSQTFSSRLSRASLKFDDGKQVKISSKFLRENNYKVGFVIWFARSGPTSTSTYQRHFGTLVKWLLDEGLIADSQYDKVDPKNFPSLSGYLDNNAGSDVVLRVFLFKTMQ